MVGVQVIEVVRCERTQEEPFGAEGQRQRGHRSGVPPRGLSGTPGDRTAEPSTTRLGDKAVLGASHRQRNAISRAAQRLGLRSPSLSRQLRPLETEAGVLLYARSPAGTTLTATTTPYWPPATPPDGGPPCAPRLRAGRCCWRS
ncbi:LysR family transcriptional regulator [Streptomyces sp. NPDC029216]|uniref:helix-turn-helix domain-containing protein n=1 Tax=Streptomyces sp. NPDC029216 TaxID=3154701 RepID=UPI0033FF81B2